MVAFLAAQIAAASPVWSGSVEGVWWRAAFGMIVVFGLLVVCLKFLRRLPAVRGHDQARVEAIWPLGMRREIHVVRLADEVHYVYRNEQGLVLLRQESWEAFRAAHGHASDGGAHRRRPPSLLRALGRRLDVARSSLNPR